MIRIELKIPYTSSMPKDEATLIEEIITRMTKNATPLTVRDACVMWNAYLCDYSILINIDDHITDSTIKATTNVSGIKIINHDSERRQINETRNDSEENLLEDEALGKTERS